MELTIDLIRHGEALAAGKDGDAARPLSPRGVDHVIALARALAAEGWAPDHVFASALTRAQQTAALLVQHAAKGRRVTTLAALQPDGLAREVLAELEARKATAGHVVLVGHLPLLALLASSLGRDEPPFAPAQLWRITLPNGLGQAGRLAFTRRAGSY